MEEKEEEDEEGPVSPPSTPIQQVQDEEEEKEEEEGEEEEVKQNEEEVKEELKEEFDEEISNVINDKIDDEENKEDWTMMEEQKSEDYETEKTTPTKRDYSTEDTDSGSSSFGVKLRPKGGKPPVPIPVSKQTKEETPEFHKFKLRKTDSSDSGKKSEPQISGSSHDFGVKLKTRPPDTKDSTPVPPRPSNSTTYSGSPRQRSQTYTSNVSSSRSSGGGPKTLGDYQRLSNRGGKSQSTNTKITSMESSSSLQAKLVRYVNAALELRPPISYTCLLYTSDLPTKA